MTPLNTRRRFLCQSAAGLSMPWILPSRLRGANAPSQKITLGCIGLGVHGFGVNLASFLEEPDARVVSVCDVFKDRREKAKARVDQKYGQADCKAVADFREVISDPGIDAIVISTPDHWHVPLALMALAAGKHVFCEKPTLTIAQGRDLVKAVKEKGAVFQIGLEDRSLAPYHKMARIVRNGGIGRLQKIEVVLPAGTVYPKEDPQPVPDGFDYNLWLGPAPEAPYSPTRVTPQGWRNIRDYSGGKFTDWGSHLLDTAQVANFSEKTTPVAVHGKGEVPEQALTDLPVSYVLDYTYANGVAMHVEAGQINGDNGGNANLKFLGDAGWVGITGWRGRMEAHDPAVFRMPIDDKTDKLWPLPPREHRNFLDAIGTGIATTYPAEDLHALSTTMHIGNISMALNRPLKWNPEEERFNDPEADALQSRPSRTSWK